MKKLHKYKYSKVEKPYEYRYYRKIEYYKYEYLTNLVVNEANNANKVLNIFFSNNNSQVGFFLLKKSYLKVKNQSDYMLEGSCIKTRK